MTIFFPDLSHFDLDRGVHIEPGTVAVIVKATHGTAFLDRAYSTYKQQAASVGAYWTAYHWLNHGNGAGQARYCYSQIGKVPVMVDAEDLSGNTGYNGALTVQDVVDFVTELRRIGGISNLVYLPRWYWQANMGSPDLTPLKSLGVGLVSSNYRTYSDTGAGWDPYGGMSPVQWQYTSSQPYGGGGGSDFNAFRGSLVDYGRLTSRGVADVALADDPDGVWEFPRVEAIARMLDTIADKRSPEYGKPVPVVATLKDIQAKVDSLSVAGVDLDALAAKVAALLPKPPTAADVAEELATRLGNG